MPADRKTLRHARALRQSMTPAEAILWRELRDRRFANFKFRRQCPVGPYVADFLCRACMVIIELDGESHLGRQEQDRDRQQHLEKCGYFVLRFWNPDVYDDLEPTLEAIYLSCSRRLKKMTD